MFEPTVDVSLNHNIDSFSEHCICTGLTFHVSAPDAPPDAVCPVWPALSIQLRRAQEPVRVHEAGSRPEGSVHQFSLHCPGRLVCPNIYYGEFSTEIIYLIGFFQLDRNNIPSGASVNVELKSSGSDEFEGFFVQARDAQDNVIGTFETLGGE